MYDNDFFVVDLASCSSTGEIINNLSIALETLNHTGKKIVLKLYDARLNQSQLLSIQSLITSYGCILDTLETLNSDTIQVAENMNILVQKPVENRVNNTEQGTQNKQGFQSFNMNMENNDSIAVKNVNGLHFEADLDAIKKQQDEINISDDLKKAGILHSQNFNEVEEHIASKYANENIAPVVQDEFANLETPNPLFVDEPNMDANIETTDNNLNFNKNSIGVYKKAYDDIVQENQWDEVDFYETPTSDPVVLDTKETTYINQTLRSGQILEAQGNVVIIGDCHPGSEIRAVGDITVWGVLSGIAHAGYKGNMNAKVRALKLNAVQLRIGSCYSRRPDGTNVPYIIRSSVFTPEEARVVDNEIMLFKINQN